VLAIGGKPGSHEVSAWEYFFTAYGLLDEDPERAIGEIEAGLAEQPEHGGLYFHLACIYSRLGRLDEAGVALDRALELRPELQKHADEDEDLEPLRAARKP
jgi:tetratricopeptide (TPR) repeat protein